MKSKHSLLYIQLLVNTVCCIYGRQENLLFSTEHKVKKIDLDTGVVKDLANLDTIVHSIAYDVKERYVYVPRGGENVIVRFPYPNDDQTVNFETVIYTDRPYYVSFDSKNSHLYWTEQEKLEKIMRCNSDGSNLTIIVKEFSLTAFTLDTHHRWIYYSTKSSYALHRVTFDGNEKRIVMKLTALAIDIEIDFVDKRVYWIEYEKGDLKSALYNGSDVKTVVSTNVNLNSREIDIGGEYVFYTSSNTILKIHKSSGQIPTVVHTDTRQIYGLLFYKQEDIPIVTVTHNAYNRTYGYNVTLECMIDSYPNHTNVYWQHIYNETVLNITSDSPGVYGSTVTDPSLTILQVSWNESGQYICFAVNIVGNGKSESTVLIVLGDIPIVTITNAVYNRTYGDNVTLECKIDSSPNHSHVYWQHIYNETVFNVTSDSPFVYGATVTNPSLTLLQLSSEESGHYICFAVNIVGTGKSEPTTLTILGEQKDLVVNVEKDRYIVMYGRSLTLECSVHTARQSPPVREIYWQYNNNGVLTTIVKDTDGISGSSIEVPSLTILDVTTSESGIYICFAKTNNGTGQSRPINVTVIGDEPIVNVGDTISSTRYGENITLFCNITANPKVTHVYWEKEVNGTKNVLNSWTVGIRGASVETPSLTIMKSTTADAGNYKCVATNDVGTGNSETISLKVIGKLPTVSVTPVLQPVNYGESVNITCGVNANPPATIVYWEKKSNGFIKVMNNETTGTAGITVENPSMTLLHATDSDSGYYKCFAVNEFGLGYSSSVRLTVIGGLPEVSVPSLKYLTGTGHTISISCFVKNTSPEVSKVYWKRYLHGSSTIISSTSIGIKGVTVENPSLIIPSAMESMTGEYTCFAVNSVGTGSSLPAKLTVTTGFIPVVNSEDSHSIKSNSNTVVSITIAAVGAIAAVGSAIVACCSYRLNHRSGNQSESQQPSSSTELNASTAGNGDVENMNNSRQQIRSSINNPRPPSSTGSSTNAKRDV
ncbi:hemicentin-1-like isoform X6 [Mytilus californianus]|uniref:hemicentin-1-like isoform X6 n=1 Tax=Mytilus californianus TaxID=6549 RepID=UPI0022476723|nr:hemicentin-1-like isoform X6 [Mytilus californianus]